jgi:hypothetical protein
MHIIFPQAKLFETSSFELKKLQIRIASEGKLKVPHKICEVHDSDDVLTQPCAQKNVKKNINTTYWHCASKNKKTTTTK